MDNILSGDDLVVVGGDMDLSEANDRLESGESFKVLDETRYSYDLQFEDWEMVNLEGEF